MNILVTGAAGFIGSFLCKRLLKDNNSLIFGIDNLNDYYSIKLKEERLSHLKSNKNFIFKKGDISDKSFVESIFEDNNFDCVVNLAAQAGVRYSITNPDAYIQSNIIGFYNILECCKKYKIKHLVYASSSSVYGSNSKIPYSEEDKTENPVSLYAATKKSNELLAYAYSKLYDIPCTGLRFFTVYGPMGRPDMAYFKFANKLVNNECIEIYNNGNCKRDFTYIDDIVDGIILVMNKTPINDINGVKHKVYNIGNNHPENLLDFVKILQEELINAKVLSGDYDFESHKVFLPMQKGDVEITYADVSSLERDFNFKPKTSLRDGLKQFCLWYYDYLKYEH